MRFSDMMGSGDEPSSKRPAPSQSPDVIADALAPYLDAPAPPPAPSPPSAPFVASATAEAFYEADDEPVFDTEAFDTEAFETEAFETEARGPEVLLGVSPEPVAEVIPIRVPTAISDLVPVSDDLLPRRR